MLNKSNTGTTKENIERNDAIDELTIQFIRDLQKTAFGNESLDEHQLLDTAKSVLEATTPIIEGATGKTILVIDSNY